MGNVGAEDASEYVELIDHNELEPLEECGPSSMLGDDSVVQHFWIGEHHIGVASHPPTLVGVGVAIVGSRLQSGHSEVGKGPQLILRQRLGGVEQQ